MFVYLYLFFIIVNNEIMKLNMCNYAHIIASAYATHNKTDLT